MTEHCNWCQTDVPYRCKTDAEARACSTKQSKEGSIPMPVSSEMDKIWIITQHYRPFGGGGSWSQRVYAVTTSPDKVFGLVAQAEEAMADNEEMSGGYVDHEEYEVR